MALLAYATIALVISFYDPILSIRLVSLGVDVGEAGLAFTLMTIMFALSATLIGILSEKVDRRLIIGLSVMFISGSIYMTGSDNITVTLFGLGLNGLFIGGVFAPLIPEVIATMERVINEGKFYSSGP